ncbi:conserved exported hypothetical protein [Thiomonas sp. X19]|uniref:hypothetical protein n=1 Tax=Thiomonas sp. X19 TaxID=1050370 RepID=UPI000B6F6C51|nr:hypothetical protein [Thiomonas sp. X19]SCC91370.1 conserved exported hypothetical protein [Thiomonas sp. X19]
MQKIIATLTLGSALIAGLPLASAAPQPHMHEALRALMAARQQLQVASPNKGGWRVHAIAQIDQAIASVKAGVRYGNQHP